MKPETILSAQVILPGPSGRAPGGDALVTAANIGAFTPAAADAERALHLFSEAEFETGPLIGNSFAITAPARVFESWSHLRVQAAPRGAAQWRMQDGTVRSELAGESLPKAVRDAVAAVAFPEAPEFGPGASF